MEAKLEEWIFYSNRLQIREDVISIQSLTKRLNEWNIHSNLEELLETMEYLWHSFLFIQKDPVSYEMSMNLYVTDIGRAQLVSKHGGESKKYGGLKNSLSVLNSGQGKIT